MNYQCMFTVFTATYNRRFTLHSVYESLSVQTYKNFEWIIVDDGSSDCTKDLVMRWQSEGKVRIRYFYQENQGKPSAHNLAIREASGELFVPLDSDDACRPDALERFLFHWRNIPFPEREGFSGVTCHCVDTQGKLVGNPFPADVVDSTSIEMHFRKRVKGEKWGFARTEVLRKFPFPQFAGEKFVPEGVVWNRIARRYKIRFINEGLRIYDLDSDGLTASLARIRASSPRGMRLYYQECLDFPIPILQRLEALVNFIRSSLHAGIPSRRAVNEMDTRIPTVVCLAAIPFATLLFKLDRLKLSKDII